MNGRAVFGRTIGTGLAIRLVAVLAVVLLSVALIAPLALSGKASVVSASPSLGTSARSTAPTPSGSAATIPLTGATLPALLSAAASPSTGLLLPGETALVDGALGGRLTLSFHDVIQVVNPAGLQPTAAGDLFIEATVDLKAITSTPLFNSWKTFGGIELGVGSVWPKPYLVLPDTLEAGQTVSGKLGFEVPPTGEVTVMFPGTKGAQLRLELRPAPTGPTPSPATPDGWPVTLPGDFGVAVGPNGNVYANGIALDSSGHVTSGKAFTLPGMSRVWPVAFGADGTVYVMGTQAVQAESLIGAFAPDGTLRTGWPVKAYGYVQLFPVPTGELYVSSYTGGASQTQLLGSDGAVEANWPIAAGGSAVLEADGLFELPFDSGGPTSRIVVFGADRRVSTGRATDWQAMDAGPDGTVYAWTWVLAAGSDTEVATTRIAAIGADGNPKAGWPVSIAGSASAPAFGTDGTVYLTLGPSGATSSVLALDPSGHTKAGWPVELPSGYTALSDGGAWHERDVAQAPTPGANGTLYVAAETSGNGDGKPLIAAFDAGGRVEAGWPYQPPSPFTRLGGAIGGYTNETAPLFAPSESGGLLYLVLKDRIVALSGDGKVAPGWPKEVTGENAVTAMPDGGILVCDGWSDAGDNPHTTITRWTAAGDIAH